MHHTLHSLPKHISSMSNMEKNVFFVLFSLAEWNSNLVYLNDFTREKIRKLGISDKSLIPHLHTLTKKNFFKHEMNNVYRINPKMAWYGEEKERKKVIESWEWGINLVI